MKQNNKKLIAITGMIGSGKSEVRSYLEKRGESCIDCDKINSDLLQDRGYLSGLKSIFPEAFSEDIFHRDILRKMIFSSEKDRNRLNNYSHSEIKKKMLQLIEKIDNSRVFVEVPLLNESGFSDLFDWIWVVTSDEKNRIDRLKSRNGYDDELIKKQILSQQEYKGNQDIIKYFPNNGSKNSLYEAIEKELSNL